MQDSVLNAYIDSARACIADRDRTGVSRSADGAERGRFVLFHAAMSFCSQKVRATLSQRGVAYESNEMLILATRGPGGELIAAENFGPGYVRLRRMGLAAGNLSLVSGYSGMSSVTACGLDACAVPTLVDLKEGEVIVDSLRICLHLDAAAHGDDQLMPQSDVDRQKVMRQLEAVDLTPHPGLLYGFHPFDDRRPPLIQDGMRTVYDEKIEALNELITRFPEDDELIDAYNAKISKESAGARVQHDASFQEALRASARQRLSQLNLDLQQSRSDWLCSDSLTLADIFWAVSLVRLRYLGLGTLWADMPLVEAYYRMVTSLKSIRDEVISETIRSMPPSEHLSTESMEAAF